MRSVTTLGAAVGRWVLTLVLALAPIPAAATADITIAAASDLRYALDEVLAAYGEDHPASDIEVVYGSSGKLTTQILNGAPYDLFFSADIGYPERLQAAGVTATEPAPYATGRIVIWSNSLDAAELTLADLAADSIRRVAIAQPAHAPYGQRAKEALQSAGVWQAVQGKLVFGENIAHTAQMTRSGAAQVGIIALSLAKFPELARHGHHLIDDDRHQPLTQAYVVTRRGGDKSAVRDFAAFLDSQRVRVILRRYGFVRPD